VLTGKPPAELIREQLTKYVGPFTAKNALHTFAKQAGTDPSQITVAQIPALLESIGPLLRTLLGKAGADKVIEQVQREFSR
jgi:hypothetical protein